VPGGFKDVGVGRWGWFALSQPEKSSKKREKWEEKSLPEHKLKA